MIKSLIPVPDANLGIWKLYDDLLSRHWVAKEVSFIDDLVNWRSMHPDIKRTLIYINAFFVNADSIITDIIEERIRVHFKDNQHIQAMFAAIEANEFVHNETYSRYVSNVFEDDVRDKILTNQFVQPVDGIAWINEQYHSAEDNIAEILILQIIMEGLNFYNKFAYIYWVSDHYMNILPALYRINELVAPDENIHVMNSIELFLNHVPTSLKPPKERVHQLMEDAIRIETSWWEHVLTEMKDMTLENVRTHIEYIANEQVRMLGYEPMKKVSMPFKFMHRQSIINKSSDFFVDAGEYRNTSMANIEIYSQF